MCIRVLPLSKKWNQGVLKEFEWSCLPLAMLVSIWLSVACTGQTGIPLRV
jgi:hypothetical protein